jgi:hypothetical protein
MHGETVKYSLKCLKYSIKFSNSVWAKNCSSMHRKSKRMSAALTHIALRLFWKNKRRKFGNERNTLYFILNP